MAIWSSEIKELEKLCETLKGQLSDLEKELERLIKADDENMILLYSRRCLEVIITDLCECELKRPRKTEPLKGIIDKLHKEDKVPSHIISSMHGLNELSTYGAHPKDFDPEQVKPVLVNLDIIIKWYLKYKESRTEFKTKSAGEIITELKNPPRNDEETSREIAGERASSRKNLRTKILTGSLILLILIAAGYLIFHLFFSQQTQPEKSVAVLPFHNYSEVQNQDWMSDGLTNEIINHLYKIASFDKVVSLNSVLTYKNTNKKIPRIADELKVNYILEGTFQKIEDKVRVTVHLIEPKTDKYLWQREYDQPYKEIISIQSDIALQIAAQLRAFLTVQEKKNIQRISTTNPEAYDLLQQAKFFFSSHRTDFATVRSLVLKSLQADPDYADAYVWAGVLSLMQGLYLGITDINTAVQEALPFIEKALRIDPNNGSAHQVMGLINEFGRWNYTEAEEEYSKFRELAPKIGSPEIVVPIGEFYLKMNRPDYAVRFLKETIESEDFSCNTILIKSFMQSGRMQEAYNTIHKSLESHKEEAYLWLGESYIWLQKYDSAKTYFDYAVRFNDFNLNFPKYQAYLALVCNKTNQNNQAQKIINQLISKSSVAAAGSPDYFIGWYYSGIGKVDSAFFWLEKAYKTHSPEFSSLKVDPVFINLKKDDRYWDLYKRTGHKAYDDYRAGLKE